MKLLKQAALLMAALMMTCAPAAAQNVAKLPTAATLTGAERIAAVQGSGCATNVAPCATVAIQPSQIATYLGSGFQPSDADLTAIAALATQPIGRSLLTAADAAAIRAIAGAPPATRLISTTAPLAGGGDLSADRTLTIAAATTGAAGSMSAADKAKLDGVAAGATANAGTVTSVATSVANGLIATVSNASTTPSIAISGANLTPTTVAATGTVTGSNIAGMAAQNPAAVAITGGSVTGITDVAIADGGTGASTAAAARTNLGLGSLATQNASGPSLTGTLASTADYYGTAIRVTGSNSTAALAVGGPRGEISYDSGFFRLFGFNRTTASLIPIQINASRVVLIFAGIQLSFDSSFANYANDAAAATGGVPVGGVYRNGSILMFRVS